MDTNNTKYVRYVVGAVVLLVVLGLVVLVWQNMNAPKERRPLSDEEKRELLKNIPNTPPLSDKDKQEILQRVGTSTKILGDEEKQKLLGN